MRPSRSGAAAFSLILLATSTVLTACPAKEPTSTNGSAAREPTGAASSAPAPTQADRAKPTDGAKPESAGPALAIAELPAVEKELRAQIPAGSGDYAKVWALATLHKRGTISFKQLEDAIVALKLPPHKLGDGYLMTPSPVPPPGVKWDPKMMPEDWQGTWGEVAMVHHLGELTQDQYRQLHKAAHPTGCKL